MTDLDLAAVRAFVTVVDEGQFGHAAQVLGITQQGVSKRVAKLESQLGMSLFDRLASGTALTTAGVKVLPHARALLAVARDTVLAARAQLRPLRVAVQGERQVAAVSMRYYQDHNPDADVEVVLCTAFRSGREALRCGRVDATFARAHGGPHPLPPGTGSIAAHLEPLHLLVGRNHPLAARSAVTPAQIAPYPVWVPGAGVPSEWGDYYREWSAFSGIEILTGRVPGGPAEREDDREKGRGPFGLEAVLDRLAASDTLASFAGDGYRFPWHPHVRRLPIFDPTPAYPHALLWAGADAHPGLPPLIAHVRENYNGDIGADCWVPDADRPLFLPTHLSRHMSGHD
ncbi:LysR family transcriptional regulator [Nocardia macrotermitis]|uniref:HTH-type transcriptional regulator CatM n=1 Tax=Nocardia macrotermitis TaxID=2585198 RepID=A0A7K0D7T3_9NOCA|nr:LysR family transcriptional regulator [Nocardia macrotermitis]MQY21845.1 HTH-type transcriptional regulator CatM [Nocardia macrotermitis]